MEGTVRFLNSKVPALARRGLPAPPEVGPVVVHAAPVTASTVVVAIDVGKNEFAFSVTDVARTKLLKPRLGPRSLEEVLPLATAGHPPAAVSLEIDESVPMVSTDVGLKEMNALIDLFAKFRLAVI